MLGKIMEKNDIIHKAFKKNGTLKTSEPNELRFNSRKIGKLIENGHIARIKRR